MVHGDSGNRTLNLECGPIGEKSFVSDPLDYRRPRWSSGKASSSGAEDPGFDSRLRRWIFPGRVIPVA